MKNKFYKASPIAGISLIVLVITIIVIIILAGAVILSLSQNNPITSATEAVFKGNVGEYKSELSLYIVNQYGKNNGNYDPKTELNNLTSATTPNIQSIITSMKGDDLEKFAIEKGEIVYLDSISANEKEWAQSLGLKQSQGEAETTPYAKANSAVNEGDTGTSLTENSTIDGQNPAYNNPIIPAGFFAVNTDVASWDNLSSESWNNGLVIQDSYGNQFVWVPVDGTNVTYAKWCTTNISYTSTSDDTFPESLNETTLANKYQGFYIGRYEAGFDYNGGSIRLAEKKSTNKTTTDWSTIRDSAHTGYLWNFINYTESKNYSESMDTSYSYDTTKVGTNLVTGTEWDTVMKWIQNASINVSSDSRTWGNYVNSIAPANVSGYGALQISGYSTNWRAKNIFDLAGNVWEWTNEKYSTYYVGRGGFYVFGGADDPAASRYGYSATNSSYNVGLRSALYIK